uniref:Uncharacterized protein n=1 Tax=Arion vulgaris TaxID=1028688 RepID=A0A0B7BJU9_9EUPU
MLNLKTGPTFYHVALATNAYILTCSLPLLHAYRHTDTKQVHFYSYCHNNT